MPCCNCSNRPPTVRFRFCFSPGLFFYLGSKQASNWTEAGHELCPASWPSCRPLPPPIHPPPPFISWPRPRRRHCSMSWLLRLSQHLLLSSGGGGMGGGRAPVPPFCRCASANLFCSAPLFFLPAQFFLLRCSVWFAPISFHTSVL